jgi:hypothetical protein
MPQWQYRKLELSGDDDLHVLTAAGLDGWELVFVADTFAYLKREVSGPATGTGRLPHSSGGERSGWSVDD